MNLLEYINTQPITKDDFLYLQKFESLFYNLHNGGDTISYPMRIKPNVSWNYNLPDNVFFRTKFELMEIFKMTSSDKKINILISNPDVDLPVIKDDYRYMSQDHIPFDSEYQKMLENLSIQDLVDQPFLSSIPENINVFANSIIYGPSNLNMYPLGRDPKCRNIVENVRFDLDKKNLCFYGCTLPPKDVIHWYGRIREYIYEDVKNKDFIHSVEIKHGNMVEYTHNQMKYFEFLQHLSTFKFVIAPRGCGVDTYRMWESMYLGCVPIVVKEYGHRAFDGLPILWVDSWKDYLNLTEDYLLEKWNEMIQRDYDYDKLKFSYWEKLITEKIK